MDILSSFSQVAFLVVDFCAVFAFIGAVVLLFEALFGKNKAGRKKPAGRPGELVFFGLIMGILGQISLAAAGITSEVVGIVFRLRPTTINLLLTLAFIMMLGRFFILRTRRVRLKRM